MTLRPNEGPPKWRQIVLRSISVVGRYGGTHFLWPFFVVLRFIMAKLCMALMVHFNTFHPSNFGFPQKMIDTFRFFLMAFLARLCQHYCQPKLQEATQVVFFRVLFHRSCRKNRIDKTSVLFLYSRFKVCFLWCCKKAEIAKHSSECFSRFKMAKVMLRIH